MSTRAMIEVEGSDVKIYKHSDGYPDGEHGVLATLKPFAKFFAKKRGDDPEYLVAQIVREFAVKDHQWAQERTAEDIAEHGEDRYGWVDNVRTLGWGLCTDYHPDCEYLYLVKPNGRVVVKSGDELPW